MDKPSPLPELLAEIEALTSTEVALAVAKRKGGTRAYFPSRPEQDHWLTECVGSENATLICGALTSGHGGIELLVPMGPKTTRLARWKKMRQMIEDGFSKPVIARTCDVHERTVQNHRNGKIKSLAYKIKQLDLFD